MTKLDWIILLILAACVFRSLMRGLGEEGLFPGRMDRGLHCCQMGRSGDCADFAYRDSKCSVRYFAGFAVAFLAMMIVVLITGHMLKSSVDAVGLTGVDKLIGGVFGLLRGVVILVGLTLAAGLTQLPRTDFWRQATLSPALEIMATQVKFLLPQKLTRYIRYDR